MGARKKQLSRAAALLGNRGLVPPLGKVLAEQLARVSGGAGRVSGLLSAEAMR